MRPTPLLWQIAGASAQRKLPLPTIYPAGSVPRLTPTRAGFLPSIVNASTTLPPVFIPPPEADTNQRWDVAKKLFYKARSYYKFYKEGIKQANSNRKIRKFLKSELMKSFAHINIPGTANIVMTRSEFQLCIRTKRDWRKMPCKYSHISFAYSSICSRCIDFWRVHPSYRMAFRNIVSPRDMYHYSSIGWSSAKEDGRPRSKESPCNASCNPHNRTS